MDAKKIGLTVALVVSAAVATAPSAGAQEPRLTNPYLPAVQEPEAVMLVDFVYTNKRWYAGKARVLPCPAPSKASGRAHAGNSLVRVVGAKGESLYSRELPNPRIILVEDPKEEPALLEELDFTMRVPFSRDAGVLEFYEGGREQREPSVVVDLRKAVAEFYARGGHQQRASCQVPMSGMLKRPGDAGRDGKVLQPADILRVVRTNPNAAAEMAVAAGMTPAHLREVIDAHIRSIEDLGVSDKELAELEATFDAAYRRSRMKQGGLLDRIGSSTLQVLGGSSLTK